jgi:hypothetical protein
VSRVCTGDSLYDPGKKSSTKKDSMEAIDIHCEQFFNKVESIEHFIQQIKKCRRNAFLIIQMDDDHLELKPANCQLFLPAYIAVCDFFYLNVKSKKKEMEVGWIDPPSIHYYRNEKTKLEKPL